MLLRMRATGKNQTLSFAPAQRLCCRGRNKAYCSGQLDASTGGMYYQSEVILRMV